MAYAAIIGAIGSIVGGVVGGIGGKGKTKTPKVNLSPVTLQDPTAALSGYVSQQSQWPALESFTNKLNQATTKDYTTLLNTLYPGATTQLNQISTLAGQELSGQIPADVQAQIMRATAQQSLQGGYAGTGMGGTLTARDLGQTSQALTTQGANLYTQGTNLAKGMIPGYINPAQLLFSPAQILARSDQLNYYNTDIKNQQQLINAGLSQEAMALQQAQSQRQSSSIGNIFSSLFGSSSNPSGISKWIGGGISSALGGGGGGSGTGIEDISLAQAGFTGDVANFGF